MAAQPVVCAADDAGDDVDGRCPAVHRFLAEAAGVHGCGTRRPGLVGADWRGVLVDWLLLLPESGQGDVL